MPLAAIIALAIKYEPDAAAVAKQVIAWIKASNSPVTPAQTAADLATLQSFIESSAQYLAAAQAAATPAQPAPATPPAA